MNIKKVITYTSIIMLGCCLISSLAAQQAVDVVHDFPAKKIRSGRTKQKKDKSERVRKTQEFAGTLFEDAVRLHKNLFNWDSFKIITTIFPFFVGARIIDERLQTCFYDERHHKNKYIMPKWSHDVAQWSISVPIIGLGSQMFFGKTEDMRHTSRIFLLGVPFLIWTKDFIKKLRFEANLRPWNENFDCKERAGGGFPSGHMAEAMYTATLYGMRFGYKFALPLGGVATFLGVTFVSCNRHYLSQIVAGAGLGILYAFAADKVIENRLHDSIDIGMSVASNGSPALSFAYHF